MANPSDRSRRSFLKTGAGVVTVIGAAGWLAAYFTDRGAIKLIPVAKHLGPQAQALLAKLADAILDSTLPEEAAARHAAIVRVVDTADHAIDAFPLHVQKEVLDLLALLGVAPLRALVVGQWTGWADVSRAQVGQMLMRLRSSSMALQRAVYVGLRDLVASSYYASPDTWEQIGYPGPKLRGPGAEV